MNRKKIFKLLYRPTQIRDLIKLGTTSADDLKQMAKSLGIQNLSVDWGSNAPSLQDSIKNKHPAIWNIADNGIGTHWVASYGDQYFDPTGLPPDIQFTKYRHEGLGSSLPGTSALGARSYQWSPYQVQSVDSSYCGQYCLLWLYHAIRNDIPRFYMEFDQLDKLS